MLLCQAYAFTLILSSLDYVVLLCRHGEVIKVDLGTLGDCFDLPT